MESFAHPVGVGTQVQQRSLPPKLSEKLTFCLGGKCRPTFPRSRTSLHQANAYVCGLNSGAVLQKEVSESHSVRDFECGLGVLVDLFDPFLQSVNGFLDTLTGKARGLCARDCFSCECSYPFICP